MAYVEGNPKSKKLLKEWIKEGKEVGILSTNPFLVVTDGKVTLEGPHFPKPHTWYATGILKDGVLIKVA